MSGTLYTEPRFTNPDAARAHLESIRWPSGPICPHCGGTERNSLMHGKSHRPGLYFCGDCRDPFTVTVGTVFERSKIPLNKWLLAMQLMCSSKKGMSSHQLHRTLGVTYKTAWFMSHRIREAMRSGSLVPFGRGGGDVEVDETFIGKNRPKAEGARSYHHKNKVLSLVDRNTGHARSIVIDKVSAGEIMPILKANIAKEARILTDEGAHYVRSRFHFKGGHQSTVHSAGEYVRLSDRSVHSNTVEGYFSIFKRGMKGVYQHCGKQHLHRYLSEFDFRYCNRVALGINDAQRADIALKGISGKRLTYRRIGSAQAH